MSPINKAPRGRGWECLNGVKHFHHPVVGDITLHFNRLSLDADPSLTIFTCTATPGTRDADSLALLGSWSASTPGSERVGKSGV